MNARQTAINTVVILIVVLLAWVLVQIRSILVLLVIGILFAAAIEPVVNGLRRRGLKRGQAILLVYAVMVALVAVGLFAIIPSMVRQSQSLIDDVPSILESSRERATSIDNDVVRDALLRAIDEAEDAYDGTQGGGNSSFGSEQVISLVASVGGVVLTIVTVLVVAFYWLTEKSIIKQVMLRRVPTEQRERAFSVWEDIERKIGGWTRGQMLLCLIIGLISTVGYLILGLDYWLALGLWAGITELIPFIGPILGGAAAFAVALTESWQKALIVLVFVIILQQIESSLLVPRVMRNAVGMSPLTVILAVLIGSTLAGPLGAVLAIPVGAAVQVIVSELIQERRATIAADEATAIGSG